jgi:Skp family chaperone for outer membrane proteins
MPSPTNIDHHAVVSAPISGAPTVPAEEANGSDYRYLTARTPSAADLVFASGSGATAFGVVDLERLIAAHPSGGDSQDTRESVLRNIKRTVAVRASAHGFGLIFDISAKSSRGTPFILVTNGVPDITDEVLKELTQ